MKQILVAALALLALADLRAQPVDSDGVLRQLPMNTAAVHPPTAPQATYAVKADEIVSNGRFQSGSEGWTSDKPDLKSANRSLQIATTAIQKLAVGALQPGLAYVLQVKAASTNGAGSIAVRFREPRKSETYRSYVTPVTSASASEYRVEFTAPVYTDMAEIALLAGAGGALSVESVSLKMRKPIPRTEPVKDWDQSFTPAGYALVFNDEFNGDKLDRSKWFTRYVQNSEQLDRLNDENQRYADNDNHVMTQGMLQLTARHLPFSIPSGLNYQSGVIRSDWTLRYGFLEARLKMPGGRGVWPAFWLNSDVGESGRINWPPEIDIFEFVNNVENDKVNMIHLAASTPKGTAPVWLYTDPAFRKTNQDWYAPFDFDKGFHTIALEWTPDRLTFFCDGLKLMSRKHAWVHSDGALGGPAHILLNLAIGGAWAGRHGIDDSAFPQSLDIDWIRVYQLKD